MADEFKFTEDMIGVHGVKTPKRLVNGAPILPGEVPMTRLYLGAVGDSRAYVCLPVRWQGVSAEAKAALRKLAGVKPTTVVGKEKDGDA